MGTRRLPPKGEWAGARSRLGAATPLLRQVRSQRSPTYVLHDPVDALHTGFHCPWTELHVVGHAFLPSGMRFDASGDAARRALTWMNASHHEVSP